MSEPNSIDHWAALAGDLGAQPAPQLPQPAAASTETTSAEAAPAQAASPPPPIHQLPGKPVRPAKRPAKPPAWDQLASEFGIAPLPQPVAPPAVTSAPVVPTPAPLRGAETVAPARPTPAPLPEAAETSLEPAEIAAEIEAELTAWNDMEPTATEPQSFEPQEALDIMDETAEEFDDEPAGESGETAGPADESAPAEGDQRRGRRRRRRGRGRGRSREGADGVEAPADTQAEEQPDADAFGAGLEPEAADTARDARQQPEDDRGERRGRRRRRGRGPGRDAGREPAGREAAFGEKESGEEEPISLDEADRLDEMGAFDESAEVEEVPAAAMYEDEVTDELEGEGDEIEGEGEGDEFEDESDEFEGDDEEGEGDDSPRIGFRNIPTWHDAIGVMITKNMDSRAKNPGGSRGPGGRGGRGRGRGGRDRRGDRR